jgi:hypothetical protein
MSILLTPRQAVVYELTNMITSFQGDRIVLGWNWSAYELMYHFLTVVDIQLLQVSPQELQNTSNGWGFYSVNLIKKLIDVISKSPYLKEKFEEMIIKEGEFNKIKNTAVYQFFY